MVCQSSLQIYEKLFERKVAISAIIIAIQMISKYCKKLKYQRRIVLVTDGKGVIDPDGATEISKKIKQEGIELIVVYANDFQHMPILTSVGAWTLMTLSMVSRKRTRIFTRF